MGAWPPASVHLEATGLAIFRRDGGRTYVSLDYGEPGGGHGHPDRLNLTLHAQGIPWLVDFGTGSYVSPRASHWYRSTLAHNAPLVDGLSQAEARGVCVGYAEGGEFGWVCAQLPDGTAFDGVGRAAHRRRDAGVRARRAPDGERGGRADRWRCRGTGWAASRSHQAG